MYFLFRSVEALNKKCIQKKEKHPFWNIPVSKVLDDAVEEAVRRDMHSTKSDFIRDAVRRKLEEMGFRSTPFLEAKPVE
jgi:hypothetical protein